MGKRKLKRVQLVQIEVNGEMVDAKECAKCGEIKALEEFSRHKQCLGGRRSQCRECCAKYNREHYEANREHYRKYHIENREKILESKRKRYVRNRERHAVLMRKWYLENREKCLEYRKGYYEENRGQILLQKRDYYEKNIEQISEYRREYYKENKEKFLEYGRKWAAQNPEKVREIASRRRTRKAGLPDDVTDRRWEEIVKDDFNGSCALTGESDDLTMEHFIPLSIHHGGTYDGNLYPMVKSLNSSKWKANPFEWIQRPDIHERIPAERWNALVSYLAEKNGLTVEDFRDFVYWCFDNPRTPEQAAKDTKRGITSLDLWRASKLHVASNE